MTSSSPLGQAKCAWPSARCGPATLRACLRDDTTATAAIATATPASCHPGVTPMPSSVDVRAAPVMPPTLNIA